MKRLLLIALLPVAALCNQRAQGFCQQGGQVVVTSGLNSLTKVQASYPQCTVTVYLTGTLTIATIYSDNSNTPLANPFTANSSGLWFFYAANGRYDVALSGASIPSWTVGDILLADPAGGGTTVSSITAGAGISVNQPTGAVTVTNTWGAAPSGSQTQYLRVQPNTGNNTSLQFANLTTVNAADYNFPAQTPGGSLTGGGGAQTVTLPICPNGIVTTGTSATALYLSAGTGTAEWLRPSGGTCTSGALNGTIIVSPANNHSGAWTVQSATAGIDLACSSSASPISPAAGGSYVVIPPGDYNIFGSIRPAKGCTIDGLGTSSANGPTGAVTLHMQTAGIPMFDIANFGITIKNIQLSYGTFPAYTVGGAAATSGSIGIQAGVDGLYDVTGNSPYFNNIILNNFYNNLLVQTGTIRAQNVSSLAAVQDGIVIGGSPGLGAGYMESVLSQGSGGNGYTLNGQAALQWHSINCFNNQGWGIKINAGAAFQMDNVDCEADKSGEIFVAGPPATVGILQNVILQAAGQTSSYGVNNTAPGLKVTTGNTLGLLLSNMQIGGSEGNGMELDGNFIQVANVSAYSNGMGAQSGHTSCFTDAGVDQIITGVNCYQNPVTISGTGNMITGNQFIGPIAGVTSVHFTSTADNTFCNNVVFNPGNTAMQIDSGAAGASCVNTVLGTVTGSFGYDAQSLRTQAIQPLPNPTALAVTSNTIAPTLPLHTLGAGLIKAITAPNSAITACFDIIATAAFTTDVTANIVTPAITATIGKLYHACYNAGTGLWSLTN